MSTKQIDTKRNLRHTTKQNKNKSQSFDRCFTPPYALDPLLPYIAKDKIIWESACGDNHLVTALRDKGYKVVGTDITTGHNFFKWQPVAWDIQLTNCPYSIKLDWLEYSYHLQKPFALLLPVEILGVGKAQRLFEHYGVEIILLNKRVNFQTVNTSFAKSVAWFPTAWFTGGLQIGKPLNFGRITPHPIQQTMMII